MNRVRTSWDVVHATHIVYTVIFFDMVIPAFIQNYNYIIRNHQIHRNIHIVDIIIVDRIDVINFGNTDKGMIALKCIYTSDRSLMSPNFDDIIISAGSAITVLLFKYKKNI